MPTSLSIQVKVQIPQGMYQESLGNLYAQKGEIILPSSLWAPQTRAEFSCTPAEQTLLGKGRREDMESQVQACEEFPLDISSSLAFSDP